MTVADPRPFMPAGERAAAEAAGVPVASFKPSRCWIASLDAASAAVTARELAQVRAFIAYLCSRYSEPTRGRLLGQPLPAYGGHVTVTLLKRGAGRWAYRRWTWRSGPDYVPEPHEPGMDLVSVLDRSQTFGGDIASAWLEWKAAHPGVFGGE